MKMIRELMEMIIPDPAELEDELETLAEQMNALFDEHDAVLNESVDERLLADLDETMKRFEAAKKGMKIVWRFPPGEDRVKHSKRVLINMNKIRGLISRIQKQIVAGAKELPQGLMTSQAGSELA